MMKKFFGSLGNKLISGLPIIAQSNLNPKALNEMRLELLKLSESLDTQEAPNLLAETFKAERFLQTCTLPETPDAKILSQKVEQEVLFENKITKRSR